MGFKCPSRKNVADFLQEELAIPFDKSDNHPTTLSSSNYGMKKSELLKISFDWQMLLLKRNSVVLVFKVTQVMICESFFATENLNTCSSILRVLLLVVEIDILFSILQLFLIILITISVFFRSTMRHNRLEDGVVYLGALYFAILMVIFNGFLEVPMLIAKLPVLYKQRDLHFYPCWIYNIPSWILSIPASPLESIIWVAATYYVVGFDPQITRFFRQFCCISHCIRCQ